MSSTPGFKDALPQPYVAVRTTVTMAALPAAVDRSFPAVFGWLAAHAITATGAPFIRYMRIDMPGDLDIDIAVPLASAPQLDDDGLVADVLPGGRYVCVVHVGAPSTLVAGHAALQQWAQRAQVALDRRPADRGTTWGAFVETYLTDPAVEPGTTRWETELAYRTTDAAAPS